MSFVVRIWREARPRPDAAEVWRGYVEVVGSEDKAYFDDLTALLGFMEGRARNIKA